MSLAVNLLIAKDIASSTLPIQYKTPKTDVRHLSWPQLGIDEVRELTTISQSKAWSDEAYVLVILSTAITIEAQNALLKLFEEPPQNTIFYLLIPSDSILLPTLKSRFVLTESGNNETDAAVAKDFIKLSYAERLELIAQKAKAKDQVWMENLMTALGQLAETEKLSHQFKKSLLLSESYFRIRGASRKTLLEELALTLPVS